MASTDNTATKPYTQRAGTIWRTDDGTAVTGLLIPTRADHGYSVFVRVLAIKTSDYSTLGQFWRQGCALNDGGTLTLIGSSRTVGTDNNTLGGSSGAAIDVSGTDIRVRITGVAATDITWLISSEIEEVGKSAQYAGWING